MNKEIRKILAELKKGLENIYDSRLKALYLFGSWARGKGRKESSDIDVAVVLDDFIYACEEIEKISGLVSLLSLKFDTLIGVVPIRESDFRSRNSPFLLNIRKEAIKI